MTTPYQNVVLADSPASFVPANENAFPIHDIVQSVTNDAAHQVGTPGGVSCPSYLGSLGYLNPFIAGATLQFQNPFHSSAKAALSVELWFNSTSNPSGPTGALIGGNSGSVGNDWQLRYFTNMKPQLYIFAHGATAATLTSSPSSAVNDGNWHHVVGTWDGVTGDMHIYIDGVLNASLLASGQTGTITGDAEWLSGNALGVAWTGGETNFAVYPTVLTPTQVQTHYNAGIGLITVPDVTLQTVAAATTILTAASLTLGTQTTANSGTVPVGEIISQSPTAGSTASAGSAVNVLVSLGPTSTTVPDVTLQTVSVATGLLTTAGLVLGTETDVFNGSVPAGEVISQSPVAGTSVLSGSAVDVTVSLGASTTVPNVVGLTVGAATGSLVSAHLVLGGTLEVFSTTVGAGLIISQTPGAGSTVSVGSGVSVIVSKGSAPSVVPNVLGLTAADANAAILAAGFIPGTLDPVVTEAYAIGDVADQSPLGGIIAPQGTIVRIAIAVFIEPFDVETTVISQYANSPTILRLVENMAEYIDPRANLEAFYNYVWNVDTAVGFGLDVWGAIVGVSRLLKIVSGTPTPYFGFDNSNTPPPDWQNFGGAPFYTGAADTQAYILPDAGYRILILTKALANIVATTAPALNKLLQMLFPGRGKCYVTDDGAMTMTFVFEFSPTPVEYAILSQSGALPHPAGVTVNITVP